MRVQLLRDHPDPQLAAALSVFEREFTYPLGADQRFRIEHGADSWRFFSALGTAVYVVVQRDDQVLGVVGAALREVVQPHGASITVMYIGDLKIAASERGGMVLIRLLKAIDIWADLRLPVAYSIVMDGTALTPAHYTGRAGVPKFQALGSVTILWLRTAGAALDAESALPLDDDVGARIFSQLACGTYHAGQAHSTVRSQMPAQWLGTSSGRACGRIEDTLRAKRLWIVPGVGADKEEEMRSAHFSCFAYRQLADGLTLLAAALGYAAEAGFSMLFVAVSSDEAEAMRVSLRDHVRSWAPATIYGCGHGLTGCGQWLINTADI